MDPKAPAPQGDNSNFVPPPLEETPSVIPPPVVPPEGSQVMQTPPMETIPQQPIEPVNTAPVVDQPPVAPVPPINTPPPEIPTQKSSPIFAIALTVLLVAIIGLAGYFLYTKYLGGTGNKEAVNTVVTPVPVVATPTPDPTANWEKYINTALGFSIKYPSSWRLVGTEKSTEMVGFGPASIEEDVQWAINVYTNKTVDQLIADMGKQFDDRKVKQEQIEIGSISATKVTVTTPSAETWVSEQILINKNNKIIDISNGAIVDANFEDFYNSFEFIASSSSSPIPSSSPSAAPLTH